MNLKKTLLSVLCKVPLLIGGRCDYIEKAKVKVDDLVTQQELQKAKLRRLRNNRNSISER